MFSVGIDLVEISRIKKSMKNSRFIHKILGPNEYVQLENRNFPVQSIAANFAAKEAFSKAIGTGIFKLNLTEIELLRNENGSPYILVSDNILNAQNLSNHYFHVSVTHTKEYASVVVIVSDFK